MRTFRPNEVIVREDLDYPEGALVVAGYGEDGSLLAFQQGGGLQLVIPPEEVPRFSAVSEIEKVPIFRKTSFCLEGLDGYSFEGYTDGSLWNGWEKPYFELKTSQRVLDALGATWTFDDEKQVLRANLDLENDADEVEWEAVSLDLPDGGSVEAYAVGSGCLIWEEEENS